MAISFDWKGSYQNEAEYGVRGHSTVRTIEAYSECRFGLLEYQRKHYNGDDAEFERIMVARQGGVLVRSVDKPYREGTYWDDRRFPQALQSVHLKANKRQPRRLISAQNTNCLPKLFFCAFAHSSLPCHPVRRVSTKDDIDGSRQ